MWWVIAFIGIALAVYSFIDVLRSESHERAGLARVVWLPLVILLPFVGPIGWLIVSYMQRVEYQRAARKTRATKSAASQSSPWATKSAASQSSPWATPKVPRPPRRYRSSAPDDDPEFLAELARTLRQDPEGDSAEDPPVS